MDNVLHTALSSNHCLGQDNVFRIRILKLSCNYSNQCKQWQLYNNYWHNQPLVWPLDFEYSTSITISLWFIILSHVIFVVIIWCTIHPYAPKWYLILTAPIQAVQWSSLYKTNIGILNHMILSCKCVQVSTNMYYVDRCFVHEYAVVHSHNVPLTWNKKKSFVNRFPVNVLSASSVFLDTKKISICISQLLYLSCIQA